MKKAKEDAADRLVADVLAAVRRYKAAKDAPAKPVQTSFIHEDELQPWTCPHVTHCAHRKMCQVATELGRPTKRQAS